MPTTILCLGCQLHKPANPRLKGPQHYCGERECQRARKNAWQKAQLAANLKYREQQCAALAKWQRKRPWHRYQKEYREAHPEYVEKNRVQQRERNRKHRQHDASTKIVKMDAFPQAPVASGFYLLTPCSLEAAAKIVKMDAFVVALQVFHGDNVSAGAAFG
jgi:cobalamin-dependent methionine synthase I